jgi:hypothetical protein
MPKFLLITSTLKVVGPFDVDQFEDLTDSIDEVTDDEIDGSFVFDTDTLSLVTAESLM